MTDLEIHEFLHKNNWALTANEYFKTISNTSPQILIEKYDFENRTMTIKTNHYEFTFKWILNNI